MARTVHAYAGIVLALVLMVVGLSGTLLVFKEDYVRATLPEAQHPVDLSPPSLGKVLQRAEEAFADRDIRAVTFAKPGFGVHKVYLADGGSAYLTREGRLIDQWAKNDRLEDWFLDLHHRLLVGQTGRWITGLTGLAALMFVIAGVIAYWPARRGFRRGFVVDGTSRPELLSLHRNSGIIAAPIILIAVLTGVFMSFPATSRALFDQFGERVEKEVAPRVESYTDVQWTNGLSNAQRAFPEAAPRIAIWPRNGGVPSVRMRQDAEWHPNGRTVVTFHPETGDILQTENALALGSGRQAYNAVYPIHAAYIGGRAYDAVMALTGLSMFGLGAIGAFTFIRQRFF
ncbi:MAG: PepSY-associated TM helix domain-containing protein [Pseudomonadota bacterium]